MIITGSKITRSAYLGLCGEPGERTKAIEPHEKAARESTAAEARPDQQRE